jgi:hypothetical protein
LLPANRLIARSCQPRRRKWMFPIHVSHAAAERVRIGVVVGTALFAKKPLFLIQSVKEFASSRSPSLVSRGMEYLGPLPDKRSQSLARLRFRAHAPQQIGPISGDHAQRLCSHTDRVGAGNEGSLNVPTGMPKRVDPASRVQQNSDTAVWIEVMIDPGPCVADPGVGLIWSIETNVFFWKIGSAGPGRA